MRAIFILALSIAGGLAFMPDVRAQEIRAPGGMLRIGMSISEAEEALHTKHFQKSNGVIGLETTANGRSYKVFFRYSCERKLCRDTSHGAIWINMSQDSAGKERATDEIKKLIAEHKTEIAVHERIHEDNCTIWFTGTARVIVGLICRKLGVTLESINTISGFGIGGFTPCTENCF